MDGVVIWPPRRDLPRVSAGFEGPPPSKVVQIAVWGGDRGPEVLYALRDDGSIWRASLSGQVGLVWLPVPGIEEAVAQAFQGELATGLVGTEAPGGSEKQW